MRTEQSVTLDFECGGCRQPVSVTLQCRGPGVDDPQALAVVNVPCPTCGQLNHLCFEPSGRVRSVRPYLCLHALAAPSIN